MTFKELFENEEVRKEMCEALKKTDSKNDAEGIAFFIAEAEKRGVKATENEVRSCLVSKMSIDEDELDNISGGESWMCGFNDQCLITWKHTEGKCMQAHACTYNNLCIVAFNYE